MPSKSFELRELFHLTLLRHLGTRLSGRSYAVKGGICLRFFHRSLRLSEDMDLDVALSVRLGTLQKAVDSVVEGRALLASLIPAGITGLSSVKSKQTDTTQRWKVALILVGGESLPTKLEFSRRRDTIAYTTAVPDAELLRRYKTPPFAVQSYDAPSMAAQKISALAAPARSALRDLFDLHHLFFNLGEKIDPIAAGLADAGQIRAAAEKIRGFLFKDFKEQVLPYLSGELMDLYRDGTAFERQRQKVSLRLLELAS